MWLPKGQSRSALSGIPFRGVFANQFTMTMISSSFIFGNIQLDRHSAMLNPIIYTFANSVNPEHIRCSLFAGWPFFFILFWNYLYQKSMNKSNTEMVEFISEIQYATVLEMNQCICDIQHFDPSQGDYSNVNLLHLSLLEIIWVVSIWLRTAH